MQGDTPNDRSRRPGQSFLRSLKTKFIAAIILLVGVVIGLTAWWNLSLHTGHMLQATEDKVRALAEAIDGGIQVAMREGHTTEVQRILEGVARDPDIEQIVIFDNGGRIRQASRWDLVGRVMDRDRLSRYLAQPDFTVTGRYEDGELIQSVVKKIRNRTECRVCHGTATESLGTIQLDMSFGRTQEQIADMKRAALWTMLLTGLALAGGGGVLMIRLVDRPVARLADAMARVETGDLTAQAVCGGRDELGGLAQSFNAMVDRLRAARDEIEAYHQQRLARAERLASLGELAASVAHEIKNPLAGIAGAVRILAEDMPASDPRKEIMGEILAQIRRLDGTVRDLLTFARPAQAEIAPCFLHQVLDRVLLVLAEDPSAANVRVVREYHSDLPPVSADGKLLEQVFFNLLLKAVQAMGGQGTITLRTALGEPGTTRIDGAPLGPHVEIRVMDTGPGIPAHLLREIFTPFFTTKPRGIGLGLAITRRIVEEHGGRISGGNLPGQGAMFRICLPLEGSDDGTGERI
ncbi:MAG TPA: ATP-binding protein [Candidatus Methylomirabilis sp.]